MRVLDLGCGWAGFAAFAAERYGASVVGYTVSREQVAWAKEHYAALPVDDPPRRLPPRDRQLRRRRLDRPHGARGAQEPPRLHGAGGALPRARRRAPSSTPSAAPARARTSIPGSTSTSSPTPPSRRSASSRRAMEEILVPEDVQNIGPHYDRTLMAWWDNFDAAWPRLRAQVRRRRSTGCGSSTCWSAPPTSAPASTTSTRSSPRRRARRSRRTSARSDARVCARSDVRSAALRQRRTRRARPQRQVGGLDEEDTWRSRSTRAARHFQASSGARSASPSRPGREPLRAKAGASNVLFIVLDDTGLRAPRLLRLADPDAQPRPPRGERAALHQHAHDGALLAEPLLHADRAQPPLERDVVHHRGRDRLPGRQRPHPVRERVPLRDPARARLQHLRRRQVAPHAHRAGSAAGPYDRWPLGRGFERFYGFMGGDTHQYYPDLVYDNHQVQPPKTPEEGYHLTEDLVDRAIEFIADAKQVAPDKPFFMYFCTGAMHAPHHVPREWADKYKGQFDDGWDAYREKVFERQLELGVVPPGTQLSARDPDVAEWKRLPADEKRLYARMMEVFAGFLEHTDHHIGRLLDFLEQDRTARRHAHHGGERQRRQRRGRAARLGQREPVLQQRPRDARRRAEGDRRARRAQVLQPLPVGLGLGGQRAVPPLEARDLPRRRRAIRSSSTGRSGSRPRARFAPSTRTSSTWCRRCSTRSASRRRRRSAA